MKLKRREVKEEKILVDMFVKSHMERSRDAFLPMSTVHYFYKRQHPHSNLSVEGLGKLLPKSIKVSGRLKWKDGKPRRGFMGWNLLSTVTEA